MNQVISSKSYVASKLGIAYENLSQSYLRAATALGTNSTISFEVQKNQVSSPLVTEKLLELNDVFVATDFTVGLQQVGSDTPTDVQLLTANWYTYDDDQVFTGTNAANAGAIYGGSLRFTIDRREYIPAFPMRAFYRVGDSQTNANLITAGTTGSPAATFTGNAGINSFPGLQYGFSSLDPVAITGRQTIDIDIELGSAVSFDDSSNTVYAVLELRGFLVVNAKN